MYQDFSSWRPEQERHFVVFEQQSIESGRKAWIIGLLSAGAAAIALLAIVFSYPAPKRHNAEDEVGGKLGSEDSKRAPAASAPAPTPAATPDPAATQPSTDPAATQPGTDPAAAQPGATPAAAATQPGAEPAATQPAGATAVTPPPPPKGATKAPPTALMGKHRKGK